MKVAIIGTGSMVRAIGEVAEDSLGSGYGSAVTFVS